MLKKKIQSLVISKNLGEQSNFEIIHDANASQISGGTEDTASCPYLNKCGTYSGDCTNLLSCGTYTDAT